MPLNSSFPLDTCLCLLHPFLSGAAAGQRLSEKSTLIEFAWGGVGLGCHGPKTWLVTFPPERAALALWAPCSRRLEGAVEPWDP